LQFSRVDVAKARILIVDDIETNGRVLERVLRNAGYSEFRVLMDARQVLPVFREFAPDILLLDLHMPHLDGFTIMRQITARVPEDTYFPVLMLTGDDSVQSRQDALGAGANDFLTKPYDAVEIVLRVRNLLVTRFLHLRLEEELRLRKGAIRTGELEIAQRLALAAELRDYHGIAHTQRVGRLSGQIARALGLSDDDVELYELAAPLHDIGKIGVPDAILLKAGALTLEEFDKIKDHTSLGARMLSGSTTAVLQLAEEIALYHHENWDGTGYTPGLAGQSIPLPGRIVAVADVYDALVHDRPFKSAWLEEDAVSWIETQSGKKFDPAVVDAFRSVMAVQGLPELEDSIAAAVASIDPGLSN
jgi:putative two-component system response regulator